MKVLNRTQVTQIITKRQVTHELMLGQTNFNRTETIIITMPYMDMGVTTKSDVRWCRRNENLLTPLTKKEVILLALEQRFQLLDNKNKNGN